MCYTVSWVSIEEHKLVLFSPLKLECSTSKEEIRG